MTSSKPPAAVCPTCKRTSDEVDWYKNRGSHNGLCTYCKPCSQQRERERRHIARNGDLKRLFGITLEQYNEMLRNQDGVCRICGRPEKQKNKSLAVDHDHATGKVRGLLCHLCNIGLGSFLDQPNTLASAITYLQGNKE